MKRRRVAFAFLLASLAALASVASCGLPRPRAPSHAEIVFSGASRITLGVGRIDAASEYRPPLKPPNVEQDFPVAIAGNARRWAGDRLAASGGPLEARYRVEVARALALPGDMVRVEIAARIEIVDASGAVKATARARIETSGAVEPGQDAAARRGALYGLETDALGQFGAAMEKATRRDLVAFIIPDIVPVR